MIIVYDNDNGIKVDTDPKIIRKILISTKKLNDILPLINQEEPQLLDLKVLNMI